jgi:hypothetical protein
MESTFHIAEHGRELLYNIEKIAKEIQQILRSLGQNEHFSKKAQDSFNELSILLKNTQDVANIIEHMDGEYRSLFKNLLENLIERHRAEVASFKHANVARSVQDLAKKTLDEDERELKAMEHFIKKWEDNGRMPTTQAYYRGYPTTEYYLNYNDYPQY